MGISCLRAADFCSRGNWGVCIEEFEQNLKNNWNCVVMFANERNLS